MDHLERRRAVLEAHPRASRLQGVEPASKYVAAALVAAQLGLSMSASALPWPSFVALSYVAGATLAQALFLAIHELAHDLFFRSRAANKAFALLVNLPLLVPFAIAFRDYHKAHHDDLGVEGVDVDLPSRWERRAFRGRLGRAVRLACQIVAYALRPVLTRAPEATPWTALNVAVQLAADGAALCVLGVWPIAFLLLSTFFAGGLHPCAGHFLSEHYGADGQGTYSYYGPLNALTWNVGYHVEHHDFPRVPWSRLRALHLEAREFYGELESHRSWTGNAVTFVCDAGRGLDDRVRRPQKK